MRNDYILPHLKLLRSEIALLDRLHYGVDSAQIVKRVAQRAITYIDRYAAADIEVIIRTKARAIEWLQEALAQADSFAKEYNREESFPPNNDPVPVKDFINKTYAALDYFIGAAEGYFPNPERPLG